MYRPLFNLSEADLAIQYNNGSPEALGEIYERYWLKLYKHAQRMLNDNDMAGDAVQEVFTKLLEKRGQIAFSGKISSYLYQSIRNHIIELYNREQVKGNYLDYLIDFREETRCTTDETILANELTKLFDREMELLPPRMKEVFSLSRFENLSYREIANKTNISEGTVKKQIYNVLKILKARLTSFILIAFQLFF